MKTLQEYFLKKDNQIKGIVVSMAGYNEIDVQFRGYYIENSNIRGSFPPQPFFETYSAYRNENPYQELTHVRYFFDLKKDEITHVLTVHLYHKGIFDVGFSIDELAEGFEDNTPEVDFKESDFAQLMSLIKRKFD